MDKINKSSIVLVGGCFDFIHFGHIKFLKKAKKLGSILVVALESDENVKRRKGNSRPIHKQKMRREMISSLSFVDKVIMLKTMTKDIEYFKLVKSIRPNVIATTSGDPYLKNKKLQAKSIGAKIVVIPLVITPSTSQLAKLIGLE